MSRHEQRVDSDPTVRAAAAALGIRTKFKLSDEIVRAAELKVAGWIDDLGEELSELDDVHRLVLNRCGIRVERIDEDSDIQRLESRYPRKALPAQLEFEFSRNTEALVFRNPSADGRSSSKFIAVVDARGDRRARAWFAERHEPSHILCEDPGAMVVSRRTTVQRPEPIEQVVDAVAAVVGFWRPVVWPVLARELMRRNVLDAFDTTRSLVAPEASVEASYRAFARLCEFPLVMLRCTYGCRRRDVDGSSMALRATTIIYNSAAEELGIQVPPNFRIPADSIIHQAQSRAAPALTDTDDLGRWRDSTGRSLPRCKVRVVALGSWAAITAA